MISLIDESKKYLITPDGRKLKRLDRVWKRASKHKLLALGIPVVDMIDLTTVIFRRVLTDWDLDILEHLRRNPQVKSITVDGDIITIDFKEYVDIESFNLTLNRICSSWFDVDIL